MNYEARAKSLFYGFIEFRLLFFEGVRSHRFLCSTLFKFHKLNKENNYE